jgi:hypothetical protein
MKIIINKDTLTGLEVKQAQAFVKDNAEWLQDKDLMNDLIVRASGIAGGTVIEAGTAEATTNHFRMTVLVNEAIVKGYDQFAVVSFDALQVLGLDSDGEPDAYVMRYKREK